MVKSAIKKKLVVILGPTGIGKTKTAVRAAEFFGTEIISADSRQVYKEMQIGTAIPHYDDLHRVKHHLIQSHSIHHPFNAWQFAQTALQILTQIFSTKDTAIVAGGSMLYIDALCNGIDNIPNVDTETRNELIEKYKKEGIVSLQRMLKLFDPDFYDEVDLKNPKRLLHALEVCIITGKPYSSLRKKSVIKRPFNIIKIGLEMERARLYKCINRRVDEMLANGLLNEAKSLQKFKHLNALNTVGYKELFEYLDGRNSFEKAVELIKRNSRRYAKRQLSWFYRDKDIQWFEADNWDGITIFFKKHFR